MGAKLIKSLYICAILGLLIVKAINLEGLSQVICIILAIFILLLAWPCFINQRR